MRKVMYPSGAYRCPDCGYQAQNRKLLATHVAKEHTENALKCDLCNFITKYQANYWRHRKTLHGVNSINLCDPCKSRFPTKDDLVEHTRQEHPELLDEVLEKVSRPVQNERFDEAVAGSPQDEDEVEEEQAPTSSRDTRKRKVNYNQDEPSIEALLEQGFSEGTKELDAVETNGQLSLKHQRRLQIQRSHLCRDCDFVTKESRQYLIHRKEAHGDRLTIYDCPWCGYASKQLQKLQRHAGSCHTDQGLSAEELRSILKKVAQQSHEAAQLERETNIIRQYLQKHGTPSLKLDQKALVKTIRLPISVSDAESSRPSTPAEKKSSPSAAASSKTAACSSVSSASKTLNQWFTCKKCAFKARSKKVVEDHQRTSHAIESPSKSGLQFKCDICGFSCGDVQKYRQHVSSHGGGAVGDDDLKEEPGRAKSCNKCDFTTTYRWSFDRHVRHHNPLNGPLQCPRCDYNTNQLGSLKFHLSNHHSGTSPEDCEKALAKLAATSGGSGGGGISGSGGNTEANNIEGCEIMQCAEIEDSMPGEMEGSSIGIDESSQDEDAVTCDLCGACFLNQADLLEHSKREHITEIEAEQAQMFRSASRMSAETSASEETLQRLQNRFGLSITPVAVSGSASTTESKEPVVIELGDGKSLKHLIEGGNTNGSTCSKPLSRSGTIFKCRYCPFSTRVKQEYQKHEAIHKPFVCTLCPYKTVWKNDLSKHMSKSHGEQYEEESPAPPAAPAPPAVSDDSGSQQTTSSTGGVLRNLLSTPDVNQKDSLLFKTLQGSGDSQASPETDSPRQTFNQDEIQNQALKLPANAHYFCPYCDFMTKTASRFHIHYMQHLKVRPFECSVCRIKSNWLWDINKHIRTRVSQGDTSHRGAKCVCINEAGLRDYNKYRCFIKEGPANGEHIETSDDHGEAGVMATQGQVHPSYSSAEVQMQALAAVQARQQGGSTVPVQGSQEDSQNYMIQQLQKKERASAGALKCGHCDYTCDHKDIMLGHLGAHADVLPFICSKCGLANKWHHTAWIHLQQFHRDDQVTLKDIHLRLDYTQNGDVFEMDPNAIVNPQLTVAPNNEVSLIRQLRCSRCPYHTVQKSNMQRHREGHQRARPDLMRYKCPYCDFWQETRRAIQRHMALHPEHIKRGTQGVLDTDKAKELLLNITNNNNNNSPPSEVVSPDGTGQSEDMPRFKCDACPYVTTANAQFIYHKQFHRYNPKAKFKCDKCSYWATHAHLITQHARVHNEGTLDQKFPEGSWLPPAEVAVTTEASESDRIRTFRVMKNGVLIKMHKCRFCPLMNRRKANVRYHELLHSDMASGKYTCHLCSYRTHSQGVLGNHMKIHVPEKRRGDSGLELVEEVDEMSSEDDDESATPNKSAGGSQNEARESRPPTKIKYNCSAVESELFNLLQSRQNGGAIADDQPAPSSQRSGFQQASPSNGLSKVKKPQKVSPDPYVRRSDGLVTFQSKVNLRKWIACPECPALFMNPTEYNRHLDHHRYGDKYHCSQCSYSMNKYVFVAQHEQVHSEDYMVKKLGYCHRPTTGAGDQKATLVKNVPTSFPTPAIVASSLQSSPLSSQSSSSQVFKISLKPLSPQKRPGPQVALSDEAAANFDNEEFAVSMLIAELHESKAVFEGACSGAYKCSTCPAAFANQGVYRFHQNLHSSPARRLKCHVCTYSVDESGNMMAHAQLHYIKFGGGNKQTVKRCPKCPATFTKQNFYDGHLLRHGSGERYKCDYCDFATNKSDIISRHRVLHRQVSDELECGLGEENLDANSQISVSTLFRNASVPQTLIEDAAPITLDTALKTSEQNKVEEDKKIYACMACPYTYGRKDGIMHHLKRHVVLQQFDCPHCSFTVSNSATLRDHVKTHFICQKMNKPQAFLHYDEIKIKLDGETIFEDRGKNDGTRFYPDSIPEFREEGPDLLVEYIDPDVVTTMNALLDEICDDKRKMEREVSNSSIYGPIVRRSSSVRSSQDEPPAKRSRQSTSTGGESPNSVNSGSSTPPPRSTVSLRENPSAPASIALPSLAPNRELEIVRTKEPADIESETELAELNGDASPMEVGDNEPKISADVDDNDYDDKLVQNDYKTANTKETAHVKVSEVSFPIVSIGASDKTAKIAAEREANVIDKLVGALQQQVPDTMRDETKKAENGLHLHNGHNGIDESDRAIRNGETAEAQEERDAKTVLNTIVSHVAQSVLHV